jgi:hypothetical protein
LESDKLKIYWKDSSLLALVSPKEIIMVQPGLFGSSGSLGNTGSHEMKSP